LDPRWNWPRFRDNEWYRYRGQVISTLAGDDPSATQASVEVQKAATEQLIGAIDALFRGDLLEAASKSFDMLRVYKAALEVSSDDPWLHFQVGSFVGNHLDPDEGVLECRIAAQLEPEWELPQVEIGIIYLRAGRNEEARAHLEELTEQRTDNSWHLLYNLAEARRRCGDHSGALAAYEQGIALNPNHALMLDRAAHCSFISGDSAKGRRLAKKAHLLGSNETFSDWRAGRYRKTRRKD